MARSFDVPGPARAKSLRRAGEAAELAIVLMVAALAALWITGAPVHSLLPVQPPA